MADGERPVGTPRGGQDVVGDFPKQAVGLGPIDMLVPLDVGNRRLGRRRFILNDLAGLGVVSRSATRPKSMLAM